MSPEEQTLLYEKTRRHHPKWEPTRCSGYVHGIVDEDRLSEPQDYYLGSHDPYSEGYILGFIDARGPDIFLMDWFVGEYGDMGYEIDCQWWIKK